MEYQIYLGKCDITFTAAEVGWDMRCPVEDEKTGSFPLIRSDNGQPEDSVETPNLLITDISRDTFLSRDISQ